MPLTVRLTVQSSQPRTKRENMTPSGRVKKGRNSWISDIHVVTVAAIPTSLSYMVLFYHYNHRAVGIFVFAKYHN